MGDGWGSDVAGAADRGWWMREGAFGGGGVPVGARGEVARGRGGGGADEEEDGSCGSQSRDRSRNIFVHARVVELQD